jgi:uncharacterized protein YbjT (DUF2867 family)
MLLNMVDYTNRMIIVTGASGYICSRAVSRLLELGLPVTAMGRNAERLRQALPSGVSMAIADYDDPPALIGRLPGQRSCCSSPATASPMTCFASTPM